VTYDPISALAAIDSHAVAVLGCFAVTALATSTYLFESFRLTFRDAAYSVALPAVGWFAVHDLGFVLQYGTWFHTYDHWWVKAWWVALIGTSIVEFALVAMVIKYGWRELAPWLSKRAFTLGVTLMVAGIAALWWLVKQALDDPLYLISFPITAFWAVPFSTAMILRRGSRRGQSILQNICVAVIVLGFQGALWQVDEFFRSGPFVAFTVVAVAWSIGNVWLLRRLPFWNPGSRGPTDWSSAPLAFQTRS
jgi:hypothetical protein